MAVLVFIWLNSKNGQFVKRADICQYFGFSYGRLLYENGSLKKLIDNNLVHQIRNNQRFNGIFYISGLGNASSPISDILTITIPTNNRAIFTVYDVLGRILKQQIGNTERLQIKINDLPNGIYFLSVEQNGKFASKKFTKN